LFAIIPSAVAFLLLGDVIVATVYQSGAFVRADVVYVWFILMGSSLGLVAGTSSRLLSSTFYALEDARVPLMCAMLRVAVAALLGYISAVYGPELLNVSPRWGVVGITLASGLGAWIEYIVLGWQLRTRYAISITSGFKSKLTLWMVAMLCAFISYIIKIVLEETLAPLILGMVVLPLYVLLFVFITWLLGFSEAREGVDKVSRRLRSY
jgi:putative peptidoglycan lipid II flippase